MIIQVVMKIRPLIQFKFGLLFFEIFCNGSRIIFIILISIFDNYFIITFLIFFKIYTQEVLATIIAFEIIFALILLNYNNQINNTKIKSKIEICFFLVFFDE